MLVVPVPALEVFVRERTAHYDAGFVSPDPRFTHAHVTVLGPWRPRLVPADARVLARIAAEVEPFDFRLERIDTFPNGIIHLVPEPDAQLRELTRRAYAAFPDCPPYADEFEPVPHLTLDLRSERVTEASTRALLGDVVPCDVRAERLDLAWYEAGRCHVMDSWGLGAT